MDTKDRLYKTLDTYIMVSSIFNTQGNVWKWFESDNLHIENKKAIDILATGTEEEIDKLQSRVKSIIYGDFS